MEDFYAFEESSTNYKLVCADVKRIPRFFPELLAISPAIDVFFTRLHSLTSYLRHQCVLFIDDLLSIDLYRFSSDLEDFCFGTNAKTIWRIQQSLSKECSIPSKASNVRCGFLICDGLGLKNAEDTSVNQTSEIVEVEHELWLKTSFLGRLLFPSFGFKLAWKLTFSFLKCFYIHIRDIQIPVKSFISRAHRTLEGSSNDIGWLEHTPGLPPVQDGTDRFMELLLRIRNGEHGLPNTFLYLLIPGLFSNHSPLYFVSIKKNFSRMGLLCHIAKIHSEASVDRNAWELKQYIEELYWGSRKRVLLLGHSKGGVDAAASLAIYWSDLQDKVAGLALVQSPYGGTPIASDILREGQIADKEARRIMELFICKLMKGDMRALDDLTFERRKEFVTKHKLPEHLPIISFHTEARIAPGVLATMSHIAHAELPWLPLPSFGNNDETGQVGRLVPVVIPLSAAMAVCALHLWFRYGEKSDGLVTCRDAEVPGSTVVRLKQKLDHAWIVYSSQKKNPDDPDASEMCEVLLTMLVEMGNTKRSHVEA